MKNMTEIIKSENGSVLGMVLIFFLVMTIIGIALLTMASQEAVLFEKQLDKAKAFRMAESGIDIALWRINSGSNYLGTFSNDSISVTYDSTSMVLNSTGTSGSHQQTLSVNLYEDHPFNHIVSYSGTLDTSNFSMDVVSGHEVKSFDALPTIDLNYFIGIADHIDTTDMTFQAASLNGIYVVLGDVTMKNGTVLNGTMVLTGSIRFIGHVEIHAQQIPDTNIYYPALVALDTSQTLESEIYGFPNLIVEGAIYCSNFVILKGGTISGPIVAKDIVLMANVEIDDEGSDKYYNTFPGVEEEEKLDKYIDRGSWAYDN